MAGENPYIDKVEYELPKKKFKVTFKPLDVTIEVDPEKMPYGRSGLLGSILQLTGDPDLERQHVDIEHTCGGVCACSTCHVIIREGIESCNEASEDELDQLDEAPGVEMNSRLACQCIPNGTQDIVVEIPDWNRNAVKEEPH